MEGKRRAQKRRVVKDLGPSSVRWVVKDQDIEEVTPSTLGKRELQKRWDKGMNCGSKNWCRGGGG